MALVDRYAVIGNPIAHSKSPEIHLAFAEHAGHALAYERVLSPLDGFAEVVKELREGGFKGCNVTVPFKGEAFALCDRSSERASLAQAVNTLQFSDSGIEGENTDGLGLVVDLQERQQFDLQGASILILGAGGAVRGVLLPLLDAGVARIHIANRTAARAHDLAHSFGDPRVTASGLDIVGQGFALVLNATSAGLTDEHIPVSPEVFFGVRLAYDMVYGPKPTVFMTQAQTHGALAVCDGLGMLVEQAAEAFRLWRGVRPQTDGVYAQLRARL